jgi:hypothetical protein
MTTTPTKFPAVLKYPTELNVNVIDYVVFTAHEYRPNNYITGSDLNVDNGNGLGGARTRGNPPPKKGSTIQLFMPNSTPAVGNDNGWSSTGGEFTGQLGEIKRNLGVGAADIIFSDVLGGMANNIVQQVGSQLENIKNIPGAAQQFVLNAVAPIMGTSPNTLLALSRGQIFNPNVELIYQGPGMRSFSFDYVFLPKNRNDAINMNRIIMEFKKWSSPEAKPGSYYEIPAVWEVKYMTRGALNKNMNRFKKAALTSIVVQANSEIDIHMSFEDGTPISTSMRLTFAEVDVITRKDHEESGTYQGY